MATNGRQIAANPDDAYLLDMLLAARSPEAAHAVAVEEGFVGDENEIAR